MMTTAMLERLRARDPGAQQELRKRLFGKVKAVCLKVLQNKELAEETAEDIWMDFVYQHVDKVQEEHALGAYLRMMTVRRCVRIRQWQARHDELADQAALSAGSEQDAVNSLDEMNQVELLERCFSRLSPKVRRVLRLRYFSEMTQDAIGQALGVSKQYVNKVLMKSLEKIRACMEEGQ